jgi:hypothetical protein
MTLPDELRRQVLRDDGASLQTLSLPPTKSIGYFHRERWGRRRHGSWYLSIRLNVWFMLRHVENGLESRLRIGDAGCIQLSCAAPTISRPVTGGPDLTNPFDRSKISVHEVIKDFPRRCSPTAATP